MNNESRQVPLLESRGAILQNIQNQEMDMLLYNSY